MPRKTFAEGVQELHELVGLGTLRGRVGFDQIHAHFQHERGDLKHPHGGQAGYLRTGLMTTYDDALRHIARSLLVDGPVEGMKDFVDHLRDVSEKLAPHEDGILDHSAQGEVFDDGASVYKSGPDVPRLSEAELNRINDVRGRFQ